MVVLVGGRFLMGEVPPPKQPFHDPSSNHYRGTSLMRKRPPPQDQHRALGMVLLQGPRCALFLMSEVPL